MNMNHEPPPQNEYTYLSIPIVSAKPKKHALSHTNFEPVDSSLNLHIVYSSPPQHHLQHHTPTHILTYHPTPTHTSKKKTKAMNQV